MKRPPCPKCGKPMARGNRAGSGKLRWQCRNSPTKYCYMTTDPSKPARTQGGAMAATMKTERYRRKLRPNTKRYIITAAQNATPVHAGFWAALQVAAKHMGAELIVIPLRYKNPTSVWSASQENLQVWAKEVVPFLWNVRKALNENLVLLGDIKTQPTASAPLTGFEAITGAESGIIGHTKLQLKVVPSPSNKFPKILTTTGACTKSNYTDSKAGKLGDFHHMLGAVVIEIESAKTFHMRHIAADSGSGAFTDLSHTYTSTGVSRAARPAALVMGDTHVDYICPKVLAATFGPGGIVETLDPERLVWHDLLDAYAVNPHHRGNPFNAVAKRHSNRDDIAAEVHRAVQFVGAHTRGRESIVVSSNHDDFLKRWIVDTDWRFDPTNAAFYLETALALVQQTHLTHEGTSSPSAFGYWLGRAKIRGLRILRGDEPCTVAGVELSLHGDRGPNGARGTIRNLRRIGIRSIVGHSHTPGIDEGCTQVGTSTRLRLEYNGGPSSWLNAHCLLHADGKRQLIFIINGKWRLE